jgi:LysM repeat protein
MATASPTPVPTAARRYTVKSGDTLSGIAAKLGSTVAAIKKANGIADPRLIRVGQVLVIP